MSNFRLKKDATPFFKESLAYAIYDYETWTTKYNVDPTALEEVEPAYITFGHMNKDRNSGSLCGWDKECGSHFYFTLRFPSVKFSEHDKFTQGRTSRDLMDKIQCCINHFYESFSENLNENNQIVAEH